MKLIKYHDKRRATRKKALTGLCAALMAANLSASLYGYGGVFPAFDYLSKNPPSPLQMDILVPVYHRDVKLHDFGQQLGVAIRDYQQQVKNSSGSRITTFRLLLTRYSKTERETSYQIRQELSELTSIPKESILTIQAPSGTTFERARAVNLLQQNACSVPSCLVARIDVDMKVLPEFFHSAVKAVYIDRTAFFPIVWSEHYPLSTQLVEAQFQKNMSDPSYKLPEYSLHRGYWREFGTGMYVLSGPHAQKFMLDTSFRGWGGEDGDFFTKVRRKLTNHRVTRRKEPGLIHQWHPKFCKYGVDVFDDIQWKDCQGARLGQMGSPLGFELVVKYLEENMPEEFRHHSIFF